MKPFCIPLPRHWSRQVKSAILHVISLAHWSLIHSHSWAADSPLKRVQLAGELSQARQDIALLREEVRIKDTHMARIHPHQRPFYPPTERMAILELRAARGWNLEQTARAFLVKPATISRWMKRLDEESEQALVKLPTPVNKYPAFVAHIVKRLKVLCPAMGKKRIAQVLTRAGLRLSAASVARFLNQEPRPPKPIPTSSAQARPSARTVIAHYPNHVWHVDLTAVPSSSGFWIPWPPFALFQQWPFCWWLVVALDQFSRSIVGFCLFKRPPSSNQIRHVLNHAIQRVGHAPKYIISDKGSQFWNPAFKHWCQRHNIHPRFGAIGKYGSIAVIERFFRSLKSECTRRILIPLRQVTFQLELDIYIQWYHQHRPHQGIHGLTPKEHHGYIRTKRPGQPPEFNNELTLDLTFLKGRAHLPIVRLRKAG